jgi:hypothetical protein
MSSSTSTSTASKTPADQLAAGGETDHGLADQMQPQRLQLVRDIMDVSNRVLVCPRRHTACGASLSADVRTPAHADVDCATLVLNALTYLRSLRLEILGINNTNPYHRPCASTFGRDQLFSSKPTVENLEKNWAKDAVFEDPIAIARGYREFSSQWFGEQNPRRQPGSIR